jgi:hypothetical protein
MFEDANVRPLGELLAGAVDRRIAGDVERAAQAAQWAMPDEGPAMFAPFHDDTWPGFVIDVAPGIKCVFDCDCLEEMREPRL